MDNFGWMKFRVITRDKDIRVTEAQLKLNP